METLVATAQLAVDENLNIWKNSIFGEADGDAKSKRVSIVTGIHGDELEGQYLTYLLCDYLQNNKDKLCGRVDIYPALNPLGIDSITRGIPKFDLDMNRIFPGNKDGALQEIVAAKIIEDLVGSDICVDVHSSNIYLKEIPQIRISVPTAEVLVPYAKLMNVDFIWVHESATVLEATLAHSLNMRGTKTLVVEMGVGMRITKEYCYQIFDGFMNLLHHEGMWLGDIKPVREPVVSLNGAVGFVNSDAAGIFVPEAKFGEYVKQGDVIGKVVSPLSGTAVDITAVCDGTIFTLREYPVVYGGSLLARILQHEPREGGAL